MRLKPLLVTLTALAALCSSGSAHACRLALVLAVDVSKSVDTSDFELQFQGMASAFRDPEVKAVLLADREPVAIAAFEWSGPDHQALITDWYFVRDSAGADFLADLFDSHGRGSMGQRTAIGEAMAFSRAMLSRVPQCVRKTIDVSGDGYNNVGRTPKQVYQQYGFAEIVVNGLVVGGAKRPKLKRYYETDVIHGPGAFVIPTSDFEDYAEAIREKLLREITPRRAIAAVKTLD